MFQPDKDKQLQNCKITFGCVLVCDWCWASPIAVAIKLAGSLFLLVAGNTFNSANNGRFFSSTVHCYRFASRFATKHKSHHQTIYLVQGLSVHWTPTPNRKHQSIYNVCRRPPTPKWFAHLQIARQNAKKWRQIVLLIDLIVGGNVCVCVCVCCRPIALRFNRYESISQTIVYLIDSY